MTRKKAMERRSAEVKASGGLRAWFERRTTEQRLRSAFKPSDRAARVIPPRGEV
jgi:hypothetical protein